MHREVTAPNEQVLAGVTTRVTAAEVVAEPVVQRGIGANTLDAVYFREVLSLS